MHVLFWILIELLIDGNKHDVRSNGFMYGRQACVRRRCLVRASLRFASLNLS